MDNMSYLDQISAQARPEKPSSGLRDLFTPKRIALLVGAVILFIALAIIGSIFGGISRREQDLVIQANTRCTGLITTLTEYNRSLKSSNLRALGTSLSGVLTETQRNLSTSLSSDFSQNPDDLKAPEDETTLIEDLNVTLNAARLNDQLDNTFIREMELQISLLLSIETEALERTQKPTLQESLTSSISSLSNLRKQFEDFDTKAL